MDLVTFAPRQSPGGSFLALGIKWGQYPAPRGHAAFVIGLRRQGARQAARCTQNNRKNLSLPPQRLVWLFLPGPILSRLSGYQEKPYESFSLLALFYTLNNDFRT